MFRQFFSQIQWVMDIMTPERRILSIVKLPLMLHYRIKFHNFPTVTCYPVCTVNSFLPSPFLSFPSRREENQISLLQTLNTNRPRASSLEVGNILHYIKEDWSCSKVKESVSLKTNNLDFGHSEVSSRFKIVLAMNPQQKTHSRWSRRGPRWGGSGIHSEHARRWGSSLRGRLAPIRPTWGQFFQYYFPRF